VGADGLHSFDLGNGRTELTVTEYDWTVGQLMEMSKMGLEQCLDKMAAICAEQRWPHVGVTDE
jgi:hypothetical protein